MMSEIVNGDLLAQMSDDGDDGNELVALSDGSAEGLYPLFPSCICFDCSSQSGLKKT